MKKYLFLLLCLISVNTHAMYYYDVNNACPDALWCGVQPSPDECCPAQYVLTTPQVVQALTGLATEQNSEFVGVTSTPIGTIEKSEAEVPDLVVNSAGTLQSGVDTSKIDSLYVAFAAKCEDDSKCNMTVTDRGVTYSPKSADGCAGGEKMIGSGTASATCIPASIQVYNVSYDLSAKGKVSVANPTECQSGETIYLPDVTPTEGYEFTNWSSAGTIYKAGAAVLCNANKTFTANYVTATPRNTEEAKWITISLGNTGATSNGVPGSFACQINSKYTAISYGCYTNTSGNMPFTKMTKVPVRNTFVYKGHYVGKRQIIGSNGALTSGWKYLTTNAMAEPMWEEKTITVSYNFGNCQGTLTPTATNLQCNVGGYLTLPSVTNLPGQNQAFNQWVYNGRTVAAGTNQLTCTRGQLGGIAGSSVDIRANCNSTSGNPKWHKVNLMAGASGVTQVITALCCDENGLYSGWYSGGSGTCDSGTQLTSITKPSRFNYAYKGAKLNNMDTLLIDENGTISNTLCTASLPTSATAQWEQDNSGTYNPDDVTTVHLTFSFECDGGTCPSDLVTQAQTNIEAVPRKDYCHAGESYVNVNNCFVTINDNNPLYRQWRCDGHVVNGELYGAYDSYLCPDADTNVTVKYHTIPASVIIDYVASCAGDEYCPDLSNVTWASSCVPGSNVNLSQTGANSPLNNAYFELIGYTVDGISTNFNFKCPEQDMTIRVNFQAKAAPDPRWVTFNVWDTYDATVNSEPNIFYCQMNDGIRTCPMGCRKAASCDAEAFTGLTRTPQWEYGTSYEGHRAVTQSFVTSMILDSDGKLTDKWNDALFTGDTYRLEAKFVTSGILIDYAAGNCTGEFTTKPENRFCGQSNGTVSLPSTPDIAGVDQVFVGWKNTNDEWVTVASQCNSADLGVKIDEKATLTAVCEAHRWNTIKLQYSDKYSEWICCDELDTESNGVLWYNGGSAATPQCNKTQNVTSVKPSNAPYVFGGFKINGTFVIKPDGSVNPELLCNSSVNDKTAQAQWNIGLRWDADCGTQQCPANATDGLPATCAPGASLTVPCNNLSGYICDGWQINGTSYGVGVAVACSDSLLNETITVKYHPATVPQWATITLDDNGGNGSNPPVLHCQTTPDIDDCEMGCYASESCTAGRIDILSSVPTREGYTYAGHYIGDYAVIGSNGELWGQWNLIEYGENTAKARWTKDKYDVTVSCPVTCVSGDGTLNSVAPNTVVLLHDYCNAGTDQKIVWGCTYNGTRTNEPVELQDDITNNNSRFNMPYGDVTCSANCVSVDNSTNILNLRPFILGGGN